MSSDSPFAIDAILERARTTRRKSARCCAKLPPVTDPIREAPLEKTETGVIPQGDGWFVLNARDVSWIQSEERGQDTDFEGGQDWTQLGFRIQV